MIKIQIWDALCEMINQTIKCKNYETSHILLVILKQITPLPPWAMLEEIFNCFSPSYDNSNIEIGGRGEIILLSQQFLHLIVGTRLELTDLATEIIKYANLRTHIRKITNNYFK